MGGRGSVALRNNASSAVSVLSKEERASITKNIETHNKADNDKAESNLKMWYERQKNIVDNYESYVKTGKIKGKEDEWWKERESSYNSLKAQYEFFKKERKRLGR